MILDEHQSAVANAGCETRQLVEAGPGCGKTQVACARVASLLDRGETPESILLLSFTRTAVHELRQRISTLARGGVVLARGVEIRTIDSLAWRIASGASEAGPMTSYEDSVETALLTLRRAASGKEEELSLYMTRFSHVLVDESQDLVGARASLIVEFLNGLRAGSGWTVFLDPAQAIYGWSTDAEDEAGGIRFTDVQGKLLGQVSRVRLSKVYRTSDTSLLSLLASMRTSVLDDPTGTRLEAAHRMLSNASRGKLYASDVAGHLRALGADADRTLVLFRRRVDALFALSYARSGGLPCRLRLGGLPRVSAPWIGVLCNELARRVASVGSVSQRDVEQAWEHCLHGHWLVRGTTPDEAWRLLHRMGASGKQVDLRKVATRLAATVVPDEVFSRELGPGGAIIGTVHGSKGREAHQVVFCLPHHEPGENEDPAATDEEARVLYVAASRAMHTLDVRNSPTSRCGYVDDRAWHSTQKGLQVEIGRDGDVDPVWPMLLDEGKQAESIQQRLAAFDGQLHTVHVSTRAELDWTRRLELPGGDIVGALSQGCQESLRVLVSERARKKTKAPMSIGHLTWLDVTTVALSRDDARAEKLPFPWRETRMLLAPVVVGMGFIKKYW